MLRPVDKVVMRQETSDGAGVRLKRVIGTRELDHLDPFLLLDEFKSDKPGDYLAGFPDHPHRGFETVTYMLAGLMRHQDHKGNQGDLTAGSVQWMTAGRGIIHSEMPQQLDGLMWGFQLWVNLPAKDKMCQPRYQDIPPERIPEVRLAEGVRVRVIAGELGDVRGPVEGIVTQPLYVDVAMAPRGRFEHQVPAEHSTFAYLFEGEGEFGVTEGHPGQVMSAGSLAVFGKGNTVAIATTTVPMRFLLLAARPLREPIARYGPFVMNTSGEIIQTIQDYQKGTFLE